MAPPTSLNALGAAAVAAAALAAGGCGSDEAQRATATTTVAAPTAPAGRSVADVVERTLPSVVNVRVTGFDQSRGEGSGVVIDRKGIIVTNNHVVEGARTVTVAFNDGRHRRPLQGSVVGTAPERDLAIIRVKADDLAPARVGRSGSLRLGDGLLAIGFPLGLGGGPTVTQGIVSGLNRTIRTESGMSLEGLLQTDAAVNPGNSGGPLVDLAGRLVGINTAAAQAGLAENVGFAIAIDEALPVIREIRSKPPDKRAWLGVVVDSVDSEAEAAQLGLDPQVRGAVVISVYPGGPAAAAGVREGDVIVGVGDSDVRSTSDLSRALGDLEPGDRVRLELVDALGPRRVELELAQRPTTLPSG